MPRMQGKATGPRPVGKCEHPNVLGWPDASGEVYVEWCPVCGAIRAREAMDIPEGEWVAPFARPIGAIHRWRDDA